VSEAPAAAPGMLLGYRTFFYFMPFTTLMCGFSS